MRIIAIGDAQKLDAESFCPQALREGEVELSLRLSPGTKPDIEQLSPWHHDLLSAHALIGLLPLPVTFCLSSASKNAPSFASDFVIA
jgi:hypothetical protein